jgi:ABC-type Mn2+/Zn2+ transport system ATPase subunit
LAWSICPEFTTLADAPGWAALAAAARRRASEHRTRHESHPSRLANVLLVVQNITMAQSNVTAAEMGAEPLGRLRRYRIKGLFGGPDIDFRLAEGQPTLLTGRNGSGKSTILRSIDAVASGRWLALLRLPPFDRITLTFESDAEIDLRRKETGVHIAFDGHHWFMDLDELPRGASIESFRMSRAIRERLMHEAYEAPHLLPRHAYREELHNWAALDARLEDPELAWLSAVPSRFHVLFITDQRLVLNPNPDRYTGRPVARAESQSTRAAVDEASEHVKAQMKSALSSYAAHSQELDRDFPRRVVEAMTAGTVVSVDDLRAILQKNVDVRDRLQRVGLLPRDVAPAEIAGLPLDDPKARAVINLHAVDTLDKFAVLEDLRERLDRFIRFLNAHYETKEVVISPDVGIKIESARGGIPDRSIEPTQLSSGEQQILVLAYQVLFRSQAGTLIMIDEPELSLHVVWQDSFVDDLTAMGALDRLDFLLATHSPTLIGDREDLRRSLDR